MTLLIMAAGNGSRYGALKQFDHLGPNKEYLFEFSIFDAIENGFDHIVIVTKEQFIKDIKNYLLERIPNSVKIDVIAQNIKDLPSSVNQKFDREKPWGTAHAVWVARDYIENSFVVINADDFYGRDAFVKASNLIKDNQGEKLFGLVPYSLKDTLSDHGTVSRGICQVENGLLKGVTELTKIKREKSTVFDFDTETTLTGEEFASMNFWICDPSIFSIIESQLVEFLNDKNNIDKGEVYIPKVFQNIIDTGKFNIKHTDSSSSWFGVTYADDKEYAVRVLKNMTNNKTYPSPLWKN